MSENRLPDYLDHLSEATRQACSYIEGMDEAAFLTYKLTQQAVILNIVIIVRSRPGCSRTTAISSNDTRMCRGGI